MTEQQRKEITDIMEVGYELEEAINKTLEDDKFNWAEIVNFYPVVREIPEAVKGFATIPDSFKDLTDEDRDYFVEHFVTNFDIPDDLVEEFVEMLFEWVLQTIVLVQKGTEVFKRKKEDEG